MSLTTGAMRLATAPLTAAGRIVNGRARRDSAESRIDRFVEGITLPKVAGVLALLVLLAVTAAVLFAPTPAQADPVDAAADAASKINPLSGVAFIAGDVISKLLSGEDAGEMLADYMDSEDPLSAIISAPFTTFTAVMVKMSTNIIKWTSDTSILTATFTEINPNIYSAVHNVHSTAVIPVANVVALIVFTIGLVKVFANSSSTEGGIDLWKIMLIFLAYGATLVVINASWEIMVALYTMASKAIQAISTAAGPMPDHEVSIAATKNPGMLMAMVCCSAGVLVGVVVCCLIINVQLLARGIEIYLYACYSPIAFAFMVTEGGRQMTEAFLKRYAAVLLAGAIQMVLMLVLAASAAHFGDPGSLSDADGVVDWMCRYMMSFVWLFVVAFMMTKSSSLAKDIIGTN